MNSPTCKEIAIESGCTVDKTPLLGKRMRAAIRKALDGGGSARSKA